MYTIDEIRNSIKIYNYLQEHGELTVNDDKELYESYATEKIKDILRAYEDEVGVKIRKFDNTIYLIPNVENEFLGYKRAELKREIFGRADMKNIDFFLASYIIIYLITEFYSGKGKNAQIRDMIEIGEIDEKLTERFELLSSVEDKSLDYETKLAITDISKHWFTLLNEDNMTKIRTRRWYIYQVCSFLKKEKLINIQDETAILPTKKFNTLVANYFLNYDRIQDINNIINLKIQEEGEV
ncbi:MAG: DUF6063 family protein [Tepidibacter sp.]|jgi:hypothetical protein|uniref:DUF6063 family protein n=1 Tax=Tepidibacter sp. TaxID=2529387 RepID=UPI0025E6F088|nr:DUF6063 family protein [Tepidibacter sp.]MCT4509727.1 DUF6063 family protein [Tepidibacter sp.]MCT4584788.1 DUF6063 family protein [Peptostreptococcaceae bacterium]